MKLGHLLFSPVQLCALNPGQKSPNKQLCLKSHDCLATAFSRILGGERRLDMGVKLAKTSGSWIGFLRRDVIKVILKDCS